MAKKKNATKEIPLAEVTPQELEVRLREAEESQFRLKFRHASNPLKNPMQIRTTRREIARIKTVLNQKQKGTV